MCTPGSVAVEDKTMQYTVVEKLTRKSNHLRGISLLLYSDRHIRNTSITVVTTWKVSGRLELCRR